MRAPAGRNKTIITLQYNTNKNAKNIFFVVVVITIVETHQYIATMEVIQQIFVLHLCIFAFSSSANSFSFPTPPSSTMGLSPSSADSVDDATSESFFSQILEQEKMSPQLFFQEIWQKKPYLFRTTRICRAGTDSGNLLDGTSTRRWNALLDLLEQTSFKDESSFLVDPPLILKESLQVNRQDLKEKYGRDYFSCYLDGCSYIQNHADLLSPELAKLCQQVQVDFPNVYANTYLTPPNSQTFRPHADDRDVFVLQLVGQKEWSIYKQVPIEYPYAHEQVGKDGREVPSYVINGQKNIDCTLCVGDVLYIPRGHVHEARCSSENGMSFHVTIAIPTFDWTVAGMMAQATQSILVNSPELRKSLLPLESIGMDPQQQRDYAQKQISAAIQRLQEQATVDALLNNLQSRVERHKQRTTPIRQAQIEQGSERTPTINMNTKVRWISRPDNLPSPLIRPDVQGTLQSIESRLESDHSVYTVAQLRSLSDDPNNRMVCDLTLISWVVQCIRFGMMELVRQHV